MNEIHINGAINGPSQWGANSTQINNTGGADAVRTALALADALVRQLGDGAPPEAVAVRAELARAADTGGEPDHRRIQAWLTTVGVGIGAGSSALALVEALRNAIG
jgi:hypothetical protein